MRNAHSQPPSISHSPWLWLGLLLCLAGSSLTSAQQDQEVPVALLRLTQRGGELGFEFNYFGETQAQDQGESIKLTHLSLQEYLLLRFRGYVYHPRFLDFRTRFKIGLLQQRSERSGLDEEDMEDETSNEFLYAYDIYLTFLKDHPLSLSLFANRDRRPVLQLFTARQMIESENMGAILRWKNRFVPVDVSFTNSRFREWGFDTHSETDQDILQVNARHELEQWIRSELRYRFQDYSQTFRTESEGLDLEYKTEFKSHELNLLNTIYLDNEQKSYLDSNVRWFTQTGTDELENFFWHEHLRLQHTENFQTYYFASYTRDTFEQSSVVTYDAKAALEYQLYRSLNVHLDIHGRRTEFDQSMETVYGVTGRLDYRKRTPWGHLTAGYAQTLDSFERTGLSQPRPILNEPVTMVLGITQFLANPAVILGSITVTDTAGLVTYFEGLDYTVEVRGNRTGLRLLPGGQLSDGDTVLVDYQIEGTSDLSYYSTEQDFHLRYDVEKYLKGLSMYYRWHQLSPQDVPEEDELTILEFTEHTGGLSYHWWELTWSEEYQNYRSNAGNFDRLLSQVEGNHRLSNYLRWSWQAGLWLTDYKDTVLNGEADESKIIFGRTSLNGIIRNHGYWELGVRSHKETGRTEDFLVGILGKLGFRWRKLNIELSARAERQERFEHTRDRIQIFLQLRRLFW